MTIIVIVIIMAVIIHNNNNSNTNNSGTNNYTDKIIIVIKEPQSQAFAGDAPTSASEGFSLSEAFNDISLAICALSLSAAQG